MTGKTRNALTALAALGVVAIVLGLFLTAMPARSPAGPQPKAAQTSQDQALNDADLKAMLAERALGAPDAPVVILEHSSLSCSHCAHFHTELLPKLKAEYIDTGKVRLILNDFPLNRPALEAAILARCLPADQYFPFVDLTFSTQKAWSENPALLQQNARLAGLTDEKIKACLESKPLAEGIAARMQEAQQKWKIDSTPTFVFNDGASTLMGSLPYEDFKAEVEKYLPAKTPAK